MPRASAPVGAPKAVSGSVDHRKRLEALRDRLEAAVAEAAHRDLAPLASRYESVLATLAALPDSTKVDAVDDLAGQRARRRSNAKTA